MGISHNGFHMKQKTVSFYLHVWFGVMSSLAIILLIHYYGNLGISLAIPK